MVRLEITKGRMQGDYDIRCPRCGSSKVHVDKKGFGYGEACCGGLLFGPLGLLCGGLGSDKLIAHCLKCGNKFDAQSQLKEQWKEEEAEEERIERQELKEEEFRCYSCHKTFLLDENLFQDYEEKGYVSFKCPHCGEKLELGHKKRKKKKR